MSGQSSGGGARELDEELLGRTVFPHARRVRRVGRPMGAVVQALILKTYALLIYAVAQRCS